MAAKKFVNDNKDNVVPQSDHMFNPKLDFYDDFDAAKKKISKLGADNAWCHALSCVSVRHGMGVMIMKAVGKPIENYRRP